MKKLLSLALAFIFIAGVLPFTPIAKTASALYEDAYALMEDALENLETTVDIAACRVPYDHVASNSAELMEVFAKLRNKRPDLFYWENNVTFHAVSHGGGAYYISDVTLRYSMEKSLIPGARAFVDEQTDAMIADMPGVTSLSDLGKALTAHDYIAARYFYDYSLNNGDVYSMLQDKKGTCQAYTGLYTLVLQKLGVEVSYALSEEMQHIWNLVKLDGRWYHADVTWDSVGITGRANHRYFLQSDAKWAAGPGDGYKNHRGWESEYSCDSAAYDNYFWTGVLSPIVCLPEGETFYIKQTKGSHSGILMKRAANTETELLYIDDLWRASGGQSYYPGCFTGLGAAGRFLYYNGPKAVYRYDRASGVAETVLTSSATGNICGLTVFPLGEGIRISYEISAGSPSQPGTVYTFTDYPNCPFGHQYGPWQTVNAPTENAAGLRARTCFVCGETKDESIPALNAANGYVYSVVTPPTAASEGSGAWVHPVFGTFHTVIPPLPSPRNTLTEILNDALTYSGSYARGFRPRTKITAYYSGDYDVRVFSADGAADVTGKNLATGAVIRLYEDGAVADTVTVVIPGDCTGDGTLGATDYIAIRLHILGIKTAAGAYLKAADSNNNGRIEVMDYILVRLTLLGRATLR